MNFNKNYTLDQLARYLTMPEAHRPFARYDAKLLEPEPVFSGDEAERLMEIVRMNTPNYPKFSVSKLLIDLSWASSHLEGNTYTQLDTQVLIEYGERNTSKSAEDAAMILNHKKAIEYMVANVKLDTKNVLTIHKLLADNTLAPESRHFLVPEKCGVTRSFTESGIYLDGSSYIPPQAEDRKIGFIENEFCRLITSANELPDAVSKSFFTMTRIPYLQAFYDVNKRTSRISCNIPLIQEGLSPLSFVDFEKRRYVEGMIAFCELGDERLAKNAYIDAYLSSAFRYLPLGEKEAALLSSNRDEYLSDARRYVLDGVRVAEPVWLPIKSGNNMNKSSADASVDIGHP